MGDIEVTCSISNLSITNGDEALFIPLVPTQYRRFQHNPLILSTEYSFISNNAYFTPLSLPIEGTYGYYNRIENIKRDSNVEAIEKLFKIDINSFLDIIAQQDSVYSTYGDKFKNYIVKKILFDDNVAFDPDFLFELGFSVNNDVYTFEDLPIKVTLLLTKKNNEDVYYYQFINNNNIVHTNFNTHNIKTNFLQDFQKFTNYFLNVKKENQEIVSILGQLSGMFILKDIYQKLVNYNLQELDKYFRDNVLSKKYLESLGFTYIGIKKELVSDDEELWQKDGYPYTVHLTDYRAFLFHQHNQISNRNEQNPIYTIGQFIDCWEKETGEKLDIKKLSEKNIYDEYYDDFRKKILDFDEKIKIYSEYEEEKKTNETLSETSHNKWKLLLGNNYRMYHGIKDFKTFNNPFGISYNDDKFLKLFENWIFFKTLYKDNIANEKLKEEFKMFRAFYQVMRYCNKFFFPAMSNRTSSYDPSKVLINASLEFINKKIEEKEEFLDFED